MKIAYQNVGKGLVATQEVLTWGAQEGVDVVLIGEMWKGEWDGKVHRQSHPSYEIMNVSEDGTTGCYVRKGVAKGAKPAGKGNGWARIVVEGVWINGVYARVERKKDEESRKLDQWAQELGAGGGAGTGLRVVIGDFNAHHIDWGKTTDGRGRTIKAAMEGDGWTRVTNTPSPSFRRLVDQRVRESTIDLAWTNGRGKAQGTTSPGFLASDQRQSAGND